MSTIGKKIQEGDVIDIVAGADLTGGVAIAFGTRGGVVLGDTLTGETAALQVEGVFRFTGTTADTIALGDTLGYTISSDEVTTGAGDFIIGKAVTQKAGAVAGTVDVKLED